MARPARLFAALLVLGTLATPAVPAQKGPVYDRLPERPDPKARYLIYLHGRIIEDQGPRPTSKDWGVYEYRQILDTLAASGVAVVSEQRRPNTDMDAFAEHVAQQVRQLLTAGVPAENVTVMGFSKGGGIATRASALLKDDRVNFVFLAACGDGNFSNIQRDQRDVRGRILSIYEETDEVGRSCAQLFAKSTGKGERKEIKIETGKSHGAFYQPRKEWIDPALAWARGSKERP
jgi:dienelactone hydrolase